MDIIKEKQLPIEDIDKLKVTISGERGSGRTTLAHVIENFLVSNGLAGSVGIYDTNPNINGRTPHQVMHLDRDRNRELLCTKRISIVITEAEGEVAVIKLRYAGEVSRPIELADGTKAEFHTGSTLTLRGLDAAIAFCRKNPDWEAVPTNG